MKTGWRTALATWLGLLLASGAEAQTSSVGPGTPDLMAAHYIDVGQGAAVLLEFSCGAVLVDTGGQGDKYVDGNAKLMAYLNAFFARRTDLDRTFDAVFLTHAHADHTNGAGIPYNPSARSNRAHNAGADPAARRAAAVHDPQCGDQC